MKYALLTKARIENFQSVLDSTIEFGGLTCLVGPGDAGKSAILRALRAALLNDGEDADIRHGTNRCAVELTFEDGNVIEWWKEKGKGGCYRMGCKEYTKTGGAVPEPIAEYLGIGRIEVDSTTELTPQLSDQHDPPFILWESGSKRARILGKATRLDAVVTAQMQCRKNRDTHRREAEQAARELEEVKGQLASLPDVAELQSRFHQIKTSHELLVESERYIENLQLLQSELESARTRVKRDVGVLKDKVKGGLELVDAASLLQELLGCYDDLQELEKEWDEAEGERRTLMKDYERACEEAGVCSVCSGLLDHSECLS